MGLLKKPVVSGARGVRAVSATDKLAEGYPAVAAFVTQTTWDEEVPPTPRTTGSITLFFEDGLWKAWLNDRDARRGCCLSGEGLDTLLATIDSRLLSGELDWRAEKVKAAGGRRG